MGPGAELVGQGLEEVRGEVPVFQHIEQAKVRQAGDQNHSPAIGFVSRGDRLFLLFGGGPAQVIEPPQEKPRPIDDDSGTGKEGLQKLREQEYQLVVLDVMMPGMDGFETLEEIRKENSLPILMFTSKNDSISKVRGLRAGADDYLTKPFDMDELIARIASLIRRYTRFNQQAGAIQKLNFDGLQIDLENRSVTTSNGTFELPPKEFDLLLYCAKHQGKILTKQQIYEEVWGEEYFYDDSNIMAIISRLRKKLEVNPSSPKYIQTVKGIGYRFNKEV